MTDQIEGRTCHRAGRLRKAALALLGCLLPALSSVSAQIEYCDFLKEVHRAQISRQIQTALPGSGTGLPVKCGFPDVLTALNTNPGLFRSQLLRPELTDEQTWQVPGSVFLLHYTQTGSDAVPATDGDSNGVPDLIETAVAILDSVREQSSLLGWREPIPDYDSLFDVYFMDLELYGYPGYTQPVGPFSHGDPNTSSSFIILENDFPADFYRHDPLTSLRVTIAHEYHHAIQLAYHFPTTVISEYRKFIWFSEASAVLHEEYLYDGINDYYHYLGDFLQNPDISLIADWQEGQHIFGTVLWALYLEDTWAEAPVCSLWTIMAEEVVTPLQAHRLFAERMGTDLMQLYQQFTVWLLHTGSRAAPDIYFEEGSAYPEVRIDPLPDQGLYLTLPAFAVRYFGIPVSPSAGGYAFRLEPASEAEWGAGIAGEAGSVLSGVSVLGKAIPDGGGSMQVELLDWGQYERALCWALAGDNISQLEEIPLSMRAGLRATGSGQLITGAASGNDLILYQNYPNPFRPGRHGRMHFAFRLGTDGDIRLEIRSLSGTLVWSQEMTALIPGMHYTDETGIGWDGRDTAGELVPSGVYLLIAEAGGITRVKKFSVVR